MSQKVFLLKHSCLPHDRALALYQLYSSVYLPGGIISSRTSVRYNRSKPRTSVRSIIGMLSVIPMFFVSMLDILLSVIIMTSLEMTCIKVAIEVTYLKPKGKEKAEALNITIKATAWVIL